VLSLGFRGGTQGRHEQKQGNYKVGESGYFHGLPVMIPFVYPTCKINASL
jgi:hypothetical protein